MKERGLLLCCTAMTLMSPHMALAQTATTTDNSAGAAQASGGDEIVVTAQFRQQKLQDTPIAITAVNAASMA